MLNLLLTEFMEPNVLFTCVITPSGVSRIPRIQYSFPPQSAGCLRKPWLQNEKLTLHTRDLAQFGECTIMCVRACSYPDYSSICEYYFTA